MLKAFLALLLPPVCPICSEAAQEGRFCRKCIDGIRLIKSPMCPSCGTPFISRECEDHLCGICNMPVDYLNLKRTCATEPQVNLKGKERLKNVRNAFSAADKGVFKGKRILLIDDVYTTGATIMECSRVLKRAGAESIFVFTL